jgi:glycosyltransferase involved in cell wall biosynthesis
VNPSTEEGFGFTNLEAFSYGCPVICSDISIFHEILGDLAIYFDPNSNATLTSRLQDFIVANNSIDRNALISHADSFSWTKCAEDTSNFYHKVFSKYQK